MNRYLLLTPGPLTTSDTVKSAMLSDWCTWDEDYNQGVVQNIRRRLVELATKGAGYTSVLVQGSGTASVEAVLGSALAETDKLLIIDNGAYGARLLEIARCLKLRHRVIELGETARPEAAQVENRLRQDPDISHVAMVHCETTTGMLNPVEEIAGVVRRYEKCFIVDAMSSFGGIPMDVADLSIDFLISSANKCIQGVPGFGFVIAKRRRMEQIAGRARSLALDLYAQWQCMEEQRGKWRFTSPTHVVRAFYQALEELEREGGIGARHQRYESSQKRLVEGMRELGFKPLLAERWHSPIITSFLSPKHPGYSFKRFYALLKSRGFVIYPGKVSDADCFRIGNIGEVYAPDIERLLEAIGQSRFWLAGCSEAAAKHA